MVSELPLDLNVQIRIIVNVIRLLTLLFVVAWFSYAKYGGHPVKAEFCHEVALRLVLNTLSTSAARYKRHIEIGRASCRERVL